MSNEPPRWSRLASWREDFPLAAAFLTRNPWSPTRDPASPQAVAAASWAFPLIGILIGLAGGILYAIALKIGLSPLIAGLAAVATTILITGASFERGLAGMVDAAGASGLGICGALVLIFSVGLRAVALADIEGAGRVIAALIAAHAVARGFMPLILHLFGPPPLDTDTEPSGLEPPPPATAWAAAMIGALIVLLALDLGPGILALILAGAGMGATAIFMHNKGKARFGAAEAVGETIVLLVACAWL